MEQVASSRNLRLLLLSRPHVSHLVRYSLVFPLGGLEE